MKLFQRSAACVAAAFVLAALGACGGENTDGKESGGVPSSSEETTEKADTLVKNFWDSDVMYDETVILVAETDEGGEIVSLPAGNLLFKADEILEVKQYFHADNAGVVSFKQGVDYEYADGRITAKGTLKEDIEGKKTSVETSMPYITDRQWKGLDVFPGCGTTNTGIPSSEGDWQIPYTESYQIVQMQISVTYRHTEKWTKSVPAYQGETLSRVVSKLKRKEKTEILIFGDSISTGSNSSSILGIAPNLQPWYELMRENLARRYGAEVSLTNKSMGGWTSAQGVSDAENEGWVKGQLVNQTGLPKLLETELSTYSPDLAIIGFGMNDATLNIGLNAYANNIKKMIDCIRARNADCDIILLGTMLANPQAKDQSKNPKEYSALNVKIAQLYEHVACVDVGTMHQDILDSGKKYMDITGNNVNHPNDFMARVYAMNLLSALVES